ncbi:PD40 domain-containing protein [Mycolicibacterium sp. S2-37]|uniref:WD40 repeat domain-containing protein n=1 Tax=Mycolicibacterium sp. S2-37 TaxID=2810297 RepID=UPI001A94ACAB|nr:PD40 domain-containing protein [Mycolicibacterium sp. S2-37]MBO0680826.1 PD40 domain-containing protein [Mycolicibacterium sp. S2-37]
MTTSVSAPDIWRAEIDDAVVDLAASPDGRVAVAGGEGSLSILSVDGAVERRVQLSMGCLKVAWSPAGDRVAVGSIDGVTVVDAGGSEVARHRGGWCSSLAWSFDGARLAAGVGRTTVVLDRDGSELFRRDRDSTVTAVAWLKSRVAAAAYGGVHIYHVARSAAPQVLPFTGSLLALSISPDRRWAASGNQDATLHVWRVGKRGEELSMSGYPTKITALAFSPDSALLASGGGPDVTVWDFGGAGPRGSTPRILTAHEQAVTAVSWSPDGSLLAGAAADGRVAVWEPMRGARGRPLAAVDEVHRPAPAASVCWAAQSGRLLAGWSDGTIAARSVNVR